MPGSEEEAFAFTRRRSLDAPYSALSQDLVVRQHYKISPFERIPPFFSFLPHRSSPQILLCFLGCSLRPCRVFFALPRRWMHLLHLASRHLSVPSPSASRHLPVTFPRPLNLSTSHLHVGFTSSSRSWPRVHVATSTRARARPRAWRLPTAPCPPHPREIRSLPVLRPKVPARCRSHWPSCNSSSIW